ncbi:MAG TPA: CGNR zinc finger domain-containing protein [Ktedonobacteraceae bacterium]|nr:CGNR zinc finger domain-containing protein [Ktedonobacteraceae bacterium]
MEAICVDFINSEFRDFRGRWVRDDLQQSGWIEQFLTKWGLQVDYLPDAAMLTKMVSLRTLLRSMIETLGEGTITELDQAALNAIMLKMPLCRHLEKDANGYQLEMMPFKKDWDWIQAEIAASFAHILAYHDPRRLKICANAYCRGIFYDESKSRSKLYCTPEKCANLWKARRYRARHKNNL